MSARLILILVIAFGLMGCAKQSFSTSGGTAVKTGGAGGQAGANGGGDANGTLNQGNDPNSGSGGAGGSGGSGGGAGGGAGGSGGGTGGGTGGGAGGTGGGSGGMTGTGGGGGSSGMVTPSVHFIGPPCQRGSNCLIQFQLDAAVPQAFSFNWVTDDTLYLQTPPPGQPIYGQPNVHYVPGGGSITFQPGETLKTAYIQNINPYNIAIIIGVRMSQCTYGGTLGACSDYFH